MKRIYREHGRTARQWFGLLTVSAVTLLAMSSCAIYGTYHRDNIEDIDSLYGTAASTDTVAVPGWRQFFSDPQLQSLVETGLSRNADLGMARQRVLQAQARLSSARLDYLPSLSLTPETSVDAFNGTTSTSWELAATASWEIDIFGRVTNAKRGAQAALMASESYCKAVQTQLVATIAESYYSLLLVDAKLTVAAQTLESWTQFISTLEALKEAGNATEAAVQQAVAQKLALDADILSLKQQQREAENTLCTLLLWSPRTISRDTLPAEVFPVTLEAGVPAQLLDRRPDVCQAEAELMQSFYNVNAARAAFFPQLTLAGTAGWTDRHSGISVDPAQLFVNAAASLLQPVFQRGHLRANYRVAEAEREAALLNYQQTVLRAGAEVNNALYQSQTAQQRITVDSARVEALNKAVDHTMQLMQYGRANYLEVLTAQQSLLSARQALAEDVYTRALAMISLYHAIGGGTD